MKWHIELRSGINVLVFADGSCRPAQGTEIEAMACIEKLETALDWYARGGGVSEDAEAVARGDVDLARASEALTEDCGDIARNALKD